jgi:arylsulfatase A-like enzyme
MFTGLYGFRTGVGMAFQDDRAGLHLDFDHELLPEKLPVETYSAIVGKWHLGNSLPGGGVFLDPIVHGFDLASVTEHNLDDHYSYLKRVSFPWGGFDVQVENYSTTETTDDAINLIGTMPEPWFLVVSYHAPHKPFQVPPGGTPSGSDRDHYLQALDFLDDEIDRLFGALACDDHVIFYGDNGTPKEVGGRKGELEQGGIRVPLLVRSSMFTGDVDDQFHAVDLFGLILEMAGEPAPTGTDSLPVGDRTIVYAEIFKPLTGPPYDTRDVRAASNMMYRLWRDDLNILEEFRTMPDETVVDPSVDMAQYLLLSDFLENIE